MDFIVKFFNIVGWIFWNVFGDGKFFFIDFSKDYFVNLVILFGFGDNVDFVEFMRLYIIIYFDYEGGNVFVYIGYLVGFVFFDFFFVFGVFLNGFVGFFYGFVN